MTRLILLSGLLLLAGGCGRTLRRAPPAGWKIESWQHGAFTIRNDTTVYTAICNGATMVFKGASTVVSPDGTITRDGTVQPGASPPTCDLMVGLVGHTVPPADPDLLPAGGSKKDEDGWIVTIAHRGLNLTLKRWRDPSTHAEETLRITSSSPIQP